MSNTCILFYVHKVINYILFYNKIQEMACVYDWFLTTITKMWQTTPWHIQCPFHTTFCINTFPCTHNWFYLQLLALVWLPCCSLCLKDKTKNKVKYTPNYKQWKHVVKYTPKIQAMDTAVQIYLQTTSISAKIFKN